METLTDLQEIAWALLTAKTVEDHRALSKLLRETQTAIDEAQEASATA